ncbi:MAG: hypothetical protein JNL79_26535 [Myxococcales bacterium]|nr:hypothetical protein [Myxococcales bacterium]
MRAFGLALLVACGPPTPVPPKVPAALALPGACVDPLVDARQRLGPDAHDGPLRVERMVDLDGDGTTDPYVTHEVFCGTGGCRWQLYVQREGCAHHVGELFGMTPLPTEDPRKHGLLSLVVIVRAGCAGLARAEARVVFDGTRYVPVAERKCTCPTEESSPGEACEPWKELP